MIQDVTSLETLFNECIEVILEGLLLVDTHRLPISLYQLIYFDFKLLNAQSPSESTSQC